MGGTGVRIGSDGSDMGELDAFNTSPRPMPQAPPQMPWYERLVTPMPWEGRAVDAMFGEEELPALPTAPQHPMDDAWMQARAQAEAQMRPYHPGNTPGTSATITTWDANRPVGASPQRAPTMRMPSATVTGQAPNRQQQAWNLAKMLGFQIGDTPENADIVHRAFVKLTKGMPVAVLLNPRNRERVTQIFNTLLTQESQRPAVSQMGASRPPVQPPT